MPENPNNDLNFAKRLAAASFEYPEVKAAFGQYSESKSEFEESYARALVGFYSPTHGTFRNDNEDHPIYELSETPKTPKKQEGLLPLEFDLKFGIAEFSIKIEEVNDNSHNYKATVKSKIFNFDVGESQLEFTNGTLSRSEKIGWDWVGAHYTLDLQVSDKFKVTLKGQAWINLPFLHKNGKFGPMSWPQ
ncbi:hypothetical protein Y046_6075 [Burkholderia pseudomallei MSHR2990]|uniref:hypothetical protein n=1 Tax=Burkholderia pseudomallei TaxID=28450 RepID=UPI000538CD15|nr:hypothetical protein [Burkholderia pseudomallei]KGW80053.1 hypothetical protein Y046_6075 [Burkholderia pseudomallei MSHR2990]